MNMNLIICGIGGTGTVLVGRMLMRAAALQGLEARCAEDHGHAKRGGSVRIDLRLGEVYTPTIAEGQGDGILAMEPVEAARHLRGLKQGAVAVVEKREDPSLAVQLGLSEGVDMDKVRQAIQERCSKVVWIDGHEVAKAAGNVRSLNVALLGAFWEALGRPIGEDFMLEAIRATLPAKIHPVNEKAFALGAEAARK